MLKYTIFEKDFKYDENEVHCPNCHSDKSYLKGNVVDRVYTCKKCGCRFGVEYENEVTYDDRKPVNHYYMEG